MDGVVNTIVTDIEETIKKYNLDYRKKMDVHIQNWCMDFVVNFCI